MSMSEECKLEICERLFVKLSLYWRSAIFGLLTLLSIGSAVWAWTWSEVKQASASQNERIEQIEAAFNDIAYLRSQSNEILSNQKVIIKYFERKK